MHTYSDAYFNKKVIIKNKLCCAPNFDIAVLHQQNSFLMECASFIPQSSCPTKNDFILHVLTNLSKDFKLGAQFLCPGAGGCYFFLWLSCFSMSLSTKADGNFEECDVLLQLGQNDESVNIELSSV